jgi:hypothetical protein
LAARLVAWWIATSAVGEAFAVTSAPTASQVRAILWREIGRAHSAGTLPGRVNQTEWWLPTGKREEIVAYGRKPADMDPAAFQGIHARRVLMLFDEACGIPEPLWPAADSCISNEASRMLVIGNPDDPTAHFANVCKPGSGWYVLRISAFDTPNFTDEPVPDLLRELLVSPGWVAEKQREWGDTNPLYIAKVLAEFPDLSADGLIPLVWVRQAQDRELEPGEPHELGVDVGGGSDHTVIYERRGMVARLIADTVNPDTMQTTGLIAQKLKETGATVAKIDMVGIGRGVVDRGKEQNLPFVGVNVGESPKSHKGKDAYANLRAELYWDLRERFRAGEIAIEKSDEALAGQLCGLKWHPTSRGQVQIESKDDMRRHGVNSPDRADALMLAFASIQGRRRPEWVIV